MTLPARQPRAMSPAEATRAELRAALYDLADHLLDHADRPVLLDAIRHAWILTDLAEVGEGLVRVCLRNLQRDLQAGQTVAYQAVAQQLTRAADGLS